MIQLERLSSSLSQFWRHKARGLQYRLYVRPLDRQMRALFVLSTGRAGSTALAKVLGLSPHITSAHELNPKLFRLRKSIYDSEGFDDPAMLSEIFHGERRYVFGRAARAGVVIADTSPFLSFCVSVLARELPNSKFIYMHRRPEEFIRSGMRRQWYQSHSNDPFRLSPRPGTQAYDSWESWKPFEKICWLWAEYNSVCSSLYDRLPESRKMVLPCADFWCKPEESVERILRFLRLPNVCPNDIRAQMESPINAQSTGTFPEQTQWTALQKDRMQQIAGPMTRKLGYT